MASGFLRQGFATVVINLLVFCYGGTIGSNNVMIPRLMEGEKGEYFDLKISDDEVSWIASSCLVGTYLIVFVSNPLASRIGKRKVMLMDSVVMIVGTLVNVLSKNIILMCIGRLLMGYASLSIKSYGQAYVCEISSRENRGLNTSVYMISYCMGIVSMAFLGTVIVNWRLVVSILAVVALLAVLGGIFIHDSPEWLLQKGRCLEARKAWDFYNPNTPVSEYQKLVSESSEVAPKEKHSSGFMSTMKSFTKPEFLKPFAYLSIIICFVEWSSFPFFAFYLVIFLKKTNCPIDPYVGSTIIALVRMLSAVGATVLLHKFKRRPVYLTVAGVIAFFLTLLVGVTYEMEHHYFLSEAVRESYVFRLIPITAVIVIYCCTCLGYVNIPLAMAGEIFPAETKVAAASFITCVATGCCLLVVKNSHYLITIIGEYGLLSLFLLVVVFCWGYSYLLMPETHGLSLHEIQLLYKPIKELDLPTTTTTTPADMKRPSVPAAAVPRPARRRSSLIGSLRSNSLVAMDPAYGVESDADIQRRLDAVHEERALDLNDDVISKRRASTLSTNY